MLNDSQKLLQKLVEEKWLRELEEPVEESHVIHHPLVHAAWQVYPASLSLCTGLLTTGLNWLPIQFYKMMIRSTCSSCALALLALTCISHSIKKTNAEMFLGIDSVVFANETHTNEEDVSIK